MSAYYRLYRNVCPNITGCVRISVSILHAVSLCLYEYYKLCPYFCPHITGSIRMSVHILQVVSLCLSVFLSANYRSYRYVCPHITGCLRICQHINVASVCLPEYYRLCPITVRILQVVSVCVSAYYTLYLYLSAYYRLFPYFCPHLHDVSVCVRILQVVSVRMSVRALQVLCVFLSAYYRLFPYFCPHLHVVPVCLSEYYRLYLYVCPSAYCRLYAYVCVLLVVFFLHTQNCFHLYACPQITDTALCIMQATAMSLRTLEVLARVSAYFRLRRLVKAPIASVTVTPVTHTGRQLIPVLYTTVCHFVYQFSKFPVVKCSSNQHCALLE